MAGIAGAVCAVIGLVVLSAKRRAGTPLPKVLNVLFSITLSIGIAIAMIPVTIFVGILVDSIVSAVDGEDFVQTDITIEESGYQGTRFTADGVVYEVLDFSLVYDGQYEPIFTYKSYDLLNMGDCGNYYAIPNEQDFDLVSDGCGTVFCPESEKEQVIEYYTDASNFNAYYDDWGENRFKITDKEKISVDELADIDFDALPEKSVVLEDAEEFSIALESCDKLLFIDSYNFLVLDKKLYFVEEWSYDEDDNCTYILKQLPDDIAKRLIKIYKRAE